MKKYVLLLLVLSCSLVHGDAFKWRDGNIFTFGPEAFHMDRKLRTGTEMDGWFQGFRGGYDHIAPNSLYYGVEAGFSQGTLDGVQSNGDPLRADVLEWDAEARLGFTVGCEKWRNLLVTPFVGYHYYNGHFRFFFPSDPEPRCEDTFNAWVAGLFVSLDICDRVRAGVDFRARYMWDAKNILKEASTTYPYLDRTMGNRFHWAVQAPVDIQVCKSRPNLKLRVTPFWRHRHYGFWLNSPKNFTRTKFCNFGAAIMIWYEV